MLAESYPNLDPWLYRQETDSALFGGNPAYIQDGQRRIYRRLVEGVYAYQKYDNEGASGHTFDGARDKIASDLAQIACVEIPANLLWKTISNEFPTEFGCVQKEPPTTAIQNLESFAKSLEAVNEVDPAKAERKTARLAAAYDPRNFLFDVWVSNTDRARNYKNTLIAETSTSVLFWIIDFNCALGNKERQWSEAHKDHHGFPDNHVPVPMLIANHKDWKTNVTNFLKTESNLDCADDATIEYICRRAFAYYGDDTGNLEATQIAECLKVRKLKIKEWACQILGI